METRQETFGSGGPVSIPLKEAKVIESNGMNYVGKVSIACLWKGNEALKGAIQLSHSATRKIANEKT